MAIYLILSLKITKVNIFFEWLMMFLFMFFTAHHHNKSQCFIDTWVRFLLFWHQWPNHLSSEVKVTRNINFFLLSSKLSVFFMSYQETGVFLETAVKNVSYIIFIWFKSYRLLNSRDCCKNQLSRAFYDLIFGKCQMSGNLGGHIFWNLDFAFNL